MDWASLAETFSGPNPTRTSCPFWMVHGTETEDELRQFMQVIHKFGFEGVTLHPYDFKGFLEESNWKQWRVIVDAARKLGLTVWEQNDKDYPCGYAAGKVVAQNRNWGAGKSPCHTGKAAKDRDRSHWTSMQFSRPSNALWPWWLRDLTLASRT